MNKEKEVLGMNELCHVLGLCDKTVKKMCYEGKIPYWKAGRRWKFHKEDVLQATRDLRYSEPYEEVSEPSEEFPKNPETCKHDFIDLDPDYQEDRHYIEQGAEQQCRLCGVCKMAKKGKRQ